MNCNCLLSDPELVYVPKHWALGAAGRIFAVNLDRRRDRWAHMLRVEHEHALALTRVDAFDGPAGAPDGAVVDGAEAEDGAKPNISDEKHSRMWSGKTPIWVGK